MTDPVNNPVDKPSISPDKGPVDNTGTPLVAEAKGVMIPQHEAPKQVDPLLVDMLCWPRAHNSPEELAFAAWLLGYLKDTLKVQVVIRSEGAMSVEIPLDDLGGPKKSTTLFSCHIDTVDSKLMDPATRKKLTYDPGFGTIALDSQSPGSCLGADDTAGIWLMLKMIEAKTPGTYLFHRGEECGGISAKAMAKKEDKWLSQFSVAVAFDRKDVGDIVTVQGGARCASPKFASRLGGMLDAFGFQYKESTTGSYTDVRDYRHIIAEVVNLSCGYEGAHGRNETLDYAHLSALAAALPKVEWESLPVDRDPKAKDPEPVYQDWRAKRSTFDYAKGMTGLFDDDDEKRQWGARSKNGAKTKTKPLVPVGKLNAMERFEDNGFSNMSWDELQTAVMDDPDWACEHIVALMRENAKVKADNEMLVRLLGL